MKRRILLAVLPLLATLTPAPVRADNTADASAPLSGIDPEFAPLVAALSGRTSVPLWLPQQAPRSPDADMQCSHYGLITQQPVSQDDLAGYVVKMVCWGSTVPPDAPELVRPGAWAMVNYLGELRGSTVPFQLPHVSTQAGGAAWQTSGWQFRVWADGRDARQTVDELTQLIGASLPIPGVDAGMVLLYQGDNSYTTVAWQAGGAYYELTAYNNPAFALALAKSLVPVQPLTNGLEEPR